MGHMPAGGRLHDAIDIGRAAPNVLIVLARPGRAASAGPGGWPPATLPGRSSKVTTGSCASCGRGSTFSTSSMQAMYSASSVGTHSISFPPRQPTRRTSRGYVPTASAVSTSDGGRVDDSFIHGVRSQPPIRGSPSDHGVAVEALVCSPFAFCTLHSALRTLHSAFCISACDSHQPGGLSKRTQPFGVRRSPPNA
jgi:hypothetical protein